MVAGCVGWRSLSRWPPVGRLACHPSPAIRPHCTRCGRVFSLVSPSGYRGVTVGAFATPTPPGTQGGTFYRWVTGAQCRTLSFRPLHRGCVNGDRSKLASTRRARLPPSSGVPPHCTDRNVPLRGAWATLCFGFLPCLVWLFPLLSLPLTPMSGRRFVSVVLRALRASFSVTFLPLTWLRFALGCLLSAASACRLLTRLVAVTASFTSRLRLRWLLAWLVCSRLRWALLLSLCLLPASAFFRAARRLMLLASRLWVVRVLRVRLSLSSPLTSASGGLRPPFFWRPACDRVPF